ncbi:MAG: ketoacyl-ACP synthase III [Lachnospiraceae bacterium]|nr:ketoacyl-ACP synthase III [Lachnospiraceae bacterium]
MITTFNGKRISGILAVLPENEYDYDEETKPFATVQTKRLKKIMGYGKRRAAKADTTTSDLCIYGLRHILEKGWIRKDEIGAIIVVSICPDYYVPHISNIIHGELELEKDVICMDIPQACAGYIMGLMQAYLLLEHIGDKKVLVFTGDVLCRKDREDSLKHPTFGGDGASVTVVENDKSALPVYMNLYSDGSQREALKIPAGGYRLPRSEETAIPMDIGDGTMRSQNEMWMDGSGVFNFVQREVPPMIAEIIQYANMSIEQIDWFMFHQPNKFMLQKLADRIGVEHSKVPMNVVGDFGNSNSNTVPYAITSNVAEQMKTGNYTCCLAGFGAGLTWASMIAEMGNLDFCEMIISDL